MRWQAVHVRVLYGPQYGLRRPQARPCIRMTGTFWRWQAGWDFARWVWSHEGGDRVLGLWKRLSTQPRGFRPSRCFLLLTLVQLHRDHARAEPGADGAGTRLPDAERAHLDGGPEQPQHPVLCRAAGQGRAGDAVGWQAILGGINELGVCKIGGCKIDVERITQGLPGRVKLTSWAEALPRTPERRDWLSGSSRCCHVLDLGGVSDDVVLFCALSCAHHS